MNKLLALFFVSLLLPFTAAVPQTYANPAQVAASGFVTIGAGNGFLGVKSGNNTSCNGFNDTYGSYQASSQDSRSMFGPGLGMPCAISLTSTYDIKIVLNNGGTGVAPGQGYFSYVRIVDCTGATRIYLSSAATSSTSGANRLWQWGTGSSIVFASPCTGAPLLMTFFR